MNLTIEALNVLLLLLPGFISGQILYSFFDSDDITPAKRILDALLLSFAVYLVVSLFMPWKPLAQVNSTVSGLDYTFTHNRQAIGVSLAAIVAIPLVLGFLYHNDFFHALLRRLKVTTKSARKNTWNDVLLRQYRFIIVTLKDGRRIRGYPTMFSTDPKEGFIYLFNPAWVNDDKKSQDEPDYIESNCHGFLLNRDNIDLIEFTLDQGETLEKCSKGGWL